MKLNDTETAFVVRALMARLPKPFKCPCCGNSKEWHIGDVAEVREFNPGGLALGGSLIPLIVLTCQVCFGVQMFNAIKLGVMDPKTGQMLKLE